MFRKPNIAVVGVAVVAAVGGWVRYTAPLSSQSTFSRPFSASPTPTTSTSASSPSNDAGDLEFWRQKWEDGKTGWHLSGAHPGLQRHFREIIGPVAVTRGTDGDAGGNVERKDDDDAGVPRVFVPLCGATYDIAFLRSKGPHVVGLDASALAISKLFSGDEEDPMQLVSKQQSDSGGDDSSPLELWSNNDASVRAYVGDLFLASPSLLGTFDHVYDRGSLVAIDPRQRVDYVKLIDSLRKPGGSVMVIAVFYETPTFEPPPFSVSKKDLESLYGSVGRYDVQLLESASHKKWASSGFPEAREDVYLVTKLPLSQS